MKTENTPSCLIQHMLAESASSAGEISNAWQLSTLYHDADWG